ncbi:MAG: EF-hand domain-containing protein [Hyphomicrobiaceae bacterium]|nr:EF-hand domain-containing protein [Hyphomicrobiaceae bacterium]
MPSKRLILTIGAIVVAAGATAAVAQGFRGRDGGDGEVRNRHFGGWGWRRSITKDDYAATTRSRFAAMDVNSDGVVDTSEVAAMLRSRTERRRGRWARRHGGGRGLERMIRRFDVDRDGKVTRAEFETRVKEMFARFDLDGDGKITDADLPPMLRDRNILRGDNAGFGGRRGPRMLRFLRGADTNNDGQITLDEAMAAAGKRFVRFDRNKDGAIDAKDIEAMRAEMLDYRVKRFFHRYGVAKEGKLTLEQYTKARDAWFVRHDANNDGVLTRDELPGRGWRRHRGHRGSWHHRGHGGGRDGGWHGGGRRGGGPGRGDNGGDDTGGRRL